MMYYFKKSEFRKDPDKCNPILFDVMDEMRNIAGVPIVIHVAWSDSGHSKNSYHYRGQAVDFHFEGLSYLEQFAVISCLTAINGVGFYPWWNSPGWHIDLRKEPKFWLCVNKNTYIYDKKDLLIEISNGNIGATKQ